MQDSKQRRAAHGAGKPWRAGAGGAEGGERLRTYQPNLARELADEARRTKGAAGTEKWDGEEAASPGTAAFGAWEARKAAQRAALAAKARAKAERYQQAQQRHAAEVAAQRDREFQETLAVVVSGIVDGEGVTGETSAAVEDAGRAYAARQAALYEEWREQVFEKIQSRIQEGVARHTVAEIEARLQEAAATYVRATNEKHYGIYLDVVLPEQYDPLAPLARTFKITTRDVFDPVKRDLLKAQAERDLLRVPVEGAAATRGRVKGEASGWASGSGSNSSGSGSGGTLCSTGGGGGSVLRAGSPSRLAPAQTRQMLETINWGALRIKATPACHCIDSAGLYSVRPPAPAALVMGASRVELDDFSAPAPAECRPGKRVGGGEARRDHIDDIVKWKCAAPGSTASGYSGGDAWLEAKGKRFVPAPGVSEGGSKERGRPF